jgi:hypothetical protein
LSKKRQERRRSERLQRESLALSEPLTNIVPLRPAPQGELGISGTNNLMGEIRSEANLSLQWTRAYGTPGSFEWGEWENLERTDNAVAAALNLISAPLRDAGVELDPGGDDEKSIGIADFVRDNFQEWLEPRWPQLIEQMVKGGLGYGFSLHERVAGTRPDPRVPGGTAIYLRKLAQRLPSSIMVNGWHEKDGELAFVRQAGLRDGKWVSNIDLPADLLLLATWNRTGNNYHGFPAFRPVWYLGKMRADCLRILAIGHQRESAGVPVGEFDKDAVITDAKVTALQRQLEKLIYHENAAMVMPPGATMKWVFSPGANKGNVLETWKALGLAILEAVLAQQMALGTNNTGSRAVGEVHDATKNAFVQGIRAWLESVFNGVGAQPYTGLVRWLVDMNFGPQEKYPVLRLVVAEGELPAEAFANAVKTLSDAGALTFTEEDENDIRDRLKMKPITPEMRAKLQADKAAAQQAQLAAVAAQNKPASTPPARGPAARPRLPPAKAAALSDAPAWAPRRELRPAEQHLALADIDAFHTQARLEFERDAKAIVGDMLRGALPAIRDAMADGDPSELAGLTFPGTILAKAIEVFVERARAFGYRQARAERKRQPAGLLAKRQAGQAGVAATSFAERWGRAFKLEEEEDDQNAPKPSPPQPLPDLKAEVPAPRVDKLVKAQTKLVESRIKGRLKQQVMDYAVDAARRGESAESVVAGVEQEVEESAALRTDAGFVVARSFSMGREQFAEEQGDQIASVTYSAILDSATCGPCQSMDGAEFDFDSPEHDAAVPPYGECDGGNNCRCLLVYNYEGGGGFQKVEEEE